MQPFIAHVQRTLGLLLQCSFGICVSTGLHMACGLAVASYVLIEGSREHPLCAGNSLKIVLHKVEEALDSGQHKATVGC